MPVAKVYITYSELYDRRPTAEEMHALLKGLNAFHTVVFLSRICTMLRHAALSLNKQDAGSFQRWFAMVFFDDETKGRIEKRFGSEQADRRPICHPLQLLNMIKLSSLFCEGGEDSRADISEFQRHNLGTACLMMNDLFVTPEEVQDINLGTHDERRKQLMVQSLAQIELGNPTSLRNLLFRSYAMYRIVLQDPVLLARIRKDCGGLDIEKEFEKLTGVPIMHWLSLVFGVHTALAIHTQEEYLNRPDIFIMNRKNFVAEPAISQTHIDRFFDLLSLDFNELCVEVRKHRPVDERLDLVPFKAKPLLKTAQDNYVSSDFSLVTEKLHNGPYFVLSTLPPSDDRWRMHNAWGLVFEAYVNWLLRSLDGQDFAVFRADTYWSDGSKALDAVLVRKKVVVLFEHKGGFLRQDARYSGDVTAFMSDLDLKISEGCIQLARDIGALFPEHGVPKQLRDVVIPADAFCVLPVLVVQDPILKSPFVNYFLNQRFQLEKENFRANSSVKVLPLNVIQVTQLESLVEMAETLGLDFIDTMHRRCNMDPVMGVDLQDFISQTIPEARQMRCSRRFEEIMQRSDDEMSRILFGPDYKASMDAQGVTAPANKAGAMMWVEKAAANTK
jgi:hypothetical protein